jgi:hypothetical protein
MPRELPSCGDSGRDEARAGDLTREGSVDGEALAVVLADKGLCHRVSAVILWLQLRSSIVVS